MTSNVPALAALMAALLGAAPCAPAAALELQGMHVPVNSIKQLRFQQTLHQQYDFSCGSAALATLLTYHYGVKVTEQSVFEQMYQHGNQAKIRAEGFSLLDMQRYLATRGMRADGFALPLQELFNAALPAIVLVTEKGYRHFVVIKGARDGRILIGDPANGTRAMAREAFDAIWQNRLLFVIHDVPGQPRFNALADWRAAPRAPLADGLVPGSLADITLSKHGASAF
jgi:predicted double-glycine peptidase